MQGDGDNNKLWEVSRDSEGKIVFVRDGEVGIQDQAERIHYYETHEKRPTEGRNKGNPNGPVRTSPER